jgi:hypothetical protein
MTALNRVSVRNTRACEGHREKDANTCLRIGSNPSCRAIVAINRPAAPGATEGARQKRGQSASSASVILCTQCRSQRRGGN